MSYERAREIFEAEGVDIDKVIVDPTRFIYNVYYADYENGIYFDVHLTEHLLLDKHGGIAAMKTMAAKNDALEKRDWHTFYLRDVPCPLKIYDFQRRYRDIEPDQVTAPVLFRCDLQTTVRCAGSTTTKAPAPAFAIMFRSHDIPLSCRSH